MNLIIIMAVRSGNIIIMDKQHQHYRTKGQVFAATTVAAVISTSITNPIEVVKLNLQYFPLACPYYPHPCIYFLIQHIANFLPVIAIALVSKDP